MSNYLKLKEKLFQEEVEKFNKNYKGYLDTKYLDNKEFICSYYIDDNFNLCYCESENNVVDFKLIIINFDWKDKLEFFIDIDNYHKYFEDIIFSIELLNDYCRLARNYKKWLIEIKKEI